MSHKIVITELPEASFPREHDTMGHTDRRIRVSCLISEHRLLEARCERTDQSSGLGNIYVGRVEKIVKNLQAAFIEIAPGVACYYPMNAGRAPVFVKKLPSKDLVQGDELLVQIERESVKTKAPTVTTNLNLSGRYVVLTTEKKRIGLSSKLDRENRERLQELIRTHYHGEYGLIVRTNAGDVPEEELLSEIEMLTEKMTELVSKASTRTCFSCVYRAMPKYMSYLQNSYQQEVDEIVTDLPEVYENISEYRRQYPAFANIPVRLYEDCLLPLGKLYNLEREFTRALSKNVWLKSGGYLVIEPTEALTVIDVNTGKSVAKKEPQKHFRKINLEAAEEIALQMRLRNLSGIVIIDFIDLDSKEDQNEVLDCLRRATRRDPVPVQVLDMTKLNLVEVTRKKIEKTLKEQLT